MRRGDEISIGRGLNKADQLAILSNSSRVIVEESVNVSIDERAAHTQHHSMEDGYGKLESHAQQALVPLN